MRESTITHTTGVRYSCPVHTAATAIPADFKNTIEWHFDLTPVPEATDPDAARQDLLTRAESMREQARTDDPDQ